MAVPAITQKWIYGYDLDADGTANVGKKVRAVISESITRADTGILVEHDKTVTSDVDGDGRWAMPLHPNNETGDNPANSHWTLTFESSDEFELFIPRTASGGADDAGAIKWTTFITARADLPEPTNPSDLDARLSVVEAILPLMNTLNSAGLAALTPPVSTSLVDAASAAGTDASGSAHGLMTVTHFNLVESLKAGGVNDAALLARYGSSQASPGPYTDKYLILPQAAEPSNSGSVGWAYTSTTDGIAKIQKGASTARTRVSPGLTPVAWQATAHLTSSSNTTWTTMGSFAVTVNSYYLISGPLHYIADALVDLEVGFTGTPTGATLAWFYLGAAATVPSGGETTSTINPTLRTGTQTLTFGGTGGLTALGAEIVGVLRTGATAGTVVQQFRKGNSATGNAIVLAGSSTFFDQWS